MTWTLVALLLTALVGLAWSLRRRAVTPGVVGLSGALVLGFAAASIYALRDTRLDRLGDFLAFTAPAFLACVGACLVLSAPTDANRRDFGLRCLIPGAVVLLASAAGRVGFLDAQIILAIGALTLWLADHRRAGAPAVSIFPVVPALAAGLTAVTLVLVRPELMERSAAWVTLIAAVGALGAAAWALRHRDRGAHTCSTLALGSWLIALGLAPIIMLLRTTLANIALLHPVGIDETLQVVGLSTASAPRLIGLGRLAPEAALLTAVGVSSLIVGSRGVERALAWTLVVAGLALLAYRAASLIAGADF